MLSWIPFRASSLSVSLEMWSKILNPFAYTWLGMRENNYLVASLILIAFFMVYFFKQKILPKIRNKNALFILLDTILLILIFSLVLIFFEKNDQFIYFQF